MNIFYQPNHEETIQLSMNHYGLPHLHVCSAGHISYPNEVEETRLETDCKRFNDKKSTFQYF